MSIELKAIEVADILSVSLQTIQNWIKAGLPVKHKGGKGKASVFDSLEVTEWWAENKFKPSIGNDINEYDRTKEEARLTHHKANNEAIKENEKRGALLPTKLVVEMCSAGVINCRDRLLTVDKKLRGEFPGISEKVFDRQLELIEDALIQLGDEGVPKGLAERITEYLAEDQSHIEIGN